MRRIEIAPNEFYHIYNRGTEKRDIFLMPNDYDRFLALMYLCNSLQPVDLKLQGSTLYEVCNIARGATLIDICAYCLMPNHFHLIIREKTDGGASRFMQKISTAYTMYFNKLNERSGALFQGRFKARHADTDDYLSYLIAYVHLNPVKLIEPLWKETGIKDQVVAEQYLKHYRYSSYLDYLGVRRIENALLTTSALPQYFEAPKDFESNILYWLQMPSIQG